MSEIVLYHGSSVIVEKPMFGIGRKDNDYGSGFYTTRIKERAEEWAEVNGGESFYVNQYELNLEGLEVLDLDEYGPLAWIAEIAYNRGMSSTIAKEFSDSLISMYRIDTSSADVIVGYRADDSYGAVVEAFMDGELTVDEVKRLFWKGNLGVQYFIKSPQAFERLKFTGAYVPDREKKNILEVDEARAEVVRFLNQRRVAIARRFLVPEITVVDAITCQYVYHKDGEYYEKRESS